MRLVGTMIRSRNVGRQMAVVETWMEVRRLAFPVVGVVVTEQNCPSPAYSSDISHI